MASLKLAFVIVVIMVFGLLSWLGLTSVYGMTWDDGWYLAGAQAIARGQGYRMLFVPGEPFQVGFPPLYPTVLALVWKAWPAFPQNLWAFKALNIVSAVVILIATQALIARTYAAKRWVAIATVGMLSMSLLFTVFIDSTMSEMVYLAFTTVALAAAERLVVRDRLGAVRWVALAAVASLSLLTRTAGLALGGAVVVWLAVHRRWREAAIFSISYAAFNAPWLVWAHMMQRRGLAGSWTYSSWLNQHTHGFQLGEFLHNVIANVGEVWHHHLPHVLMPVMSTHLLDAPLARWHLPWMAPFVGGLATALCLAGLAVTARERLRVVHLYLLLSFVMILPYPSALADVGRYVAVLSPWLLYGLARGAQALYDHQEVQRRVPLRALAGACAAAVIALNTSQGLLLHAKPLVKGEAHDARLSPHKRTYVSDLAALGGWVHTRLPADAVLLYDREPQLYLATARQSVGLPERFDASVLRELGRGRPTYLVCRPDSDAHRRYVAWQQARKESPAPLFVSPGGAFEVYDLRQTSLEPARAAQDSTGASTSSVEAMRFSSTTGADGSPSQWPSK